MFPNLAAIRWIKHCALRAVAYEPIVPLGVLDVSHGFIHIVCSGCPADKPHCQVYVEPEQLRAETLEFLDGCTGCRLRNVLKTSFATCQR